jgi:hypothetical protein
VMPAVLLKKGPIASARLRERSSGSRPGMVFMDNTNAVSMPTMQGKLLAGLWVPWNRVAATMTLQQYRDLLSARLEQELTAHPEQAQQWLQSTPDRSPNLYQIVNSSPPQDWPEQIMTCDQMQMLLARISYRQGKNQELRSSELPGLQELIESI